MSEACFNYDLRDFPLGTSFWKFRAAPALVKSEEEKETRHVSYSSTPLQEVPDTAMQAWKACGGQEQEDFLFGER